MRKNPVFASSGSTKNSLHGGATKNSLHSGATTTICIVVPLHILHCGATKYGGRRKVSFLHHRLSLKMFVNKKALNYNISCPLKYAFSLGTSALGAKIVHSSMM